MTAKVRFYPRGMSVAQQMEVLGTDRFNVWDWPFVMVSFAGFGTTVSIQEALNMGVTEAELKASKETPQEYDVKLVKAKGE